MAHPHVDSPPRDQSLGRLCSHCPLGFSGIRWGGPLSPGGVWGTGSQVQNYVAHGEQRQGKTRGVGWRHVTAGAAQVRTPGHGQRSNLADFPWPLSKLCPLVSLDVFTLKAATLDAGVNSRLWNSEAGDVHWGCSQWGWVGLKEVTRVTQHELLRCERLRQMFAHPYARQLHSQ